MEEIGAGKKIKDELNKPKSGQIKSKAEECNKSPKEVIKDLKTNKEKP